MSCSAAAPLLLSLLPLVVLVAACNPAAGLLSAPAEVAPNLVALAPRSTTFAWTRMSEGDAPVTYALSERGEVVAELPGIHIAAAGTQWTWQEAVEPVNTTACEGATARPAGEGWATRVSLVPADAGHDPLALVVPPLSDGDNEVEHTARLLASIGPYLFIEESTYAYACGAHGKSEVRFTVWNVEEGGTLDLLRELPDRDRLVAVGRTPRDGDASGAADADSGGGDDSPTLTELLPRVGPHGRLEASALVSVPSCYACSGGGWNSYTSSTPIPVELPESLRRLGPVPAAVQHFADEHPALTIAGFSVADLDSRVTSPRPHGAARWPQ